MAAASLVDAENPPAFPLFTPDGHYNGSVADHGMSLRDWFAGQALAGVIPACAGDIWARHLTRAEYFALTAYQLADAMLAERAKAVKHG